MPKKANHPEKGSQIKVDPITELKDIKSIKKLLSDHPRNFCLFTMGINTNLRASDLTNIRVKQIRGLKAGDDMVIKEKKTEKDRRITLNSSCIDSIQKLLDSVDLLDDDYLFASRKGKGKLSVQHVNRLVKVWCKLVNLKGNYGSHTLRKTWGFHQRKTFKTEIPTLMECFNHSTQKQTLKYLGIQPEEIKAVYANEL